MIVKRDNELDIEFDGELVGSVKSEEKTGRWTELSVYKTHGGKYVCEKKGCTKWAGESTRFSGAVCESIDKVIQFFGASRLAKELYAECDISATVKVN